MNAWLGRGLALAVAASLQGVEPPATQALHPLLGIPYCEDAVEDATGRWTTFARPGTFLPRPGLNCSGFLVAAARRTLGYGGSPAAAARDRLGDSGQGAPGGQDWDFGWDLVLNVSEGKQRHWLFPDGDRAVGPEDGRTLRGFRVQDEAAWAALRTRWRPGRVYLATFHRGAGIRTHHHHVGLVLAGPEGGLWFYHTLPRGRVHRLNLARPEGYRRLCTMFGPGERLLVLEVRP